MHKSGIHLIALAIIFCCLSSKVLAQTKEVKAKTSMSPKEIEAPKAVISAKNALVPKTATSAKTAVGPKLSRETKVLVDPKKIGVSKKVADLQIAVLKDGIPLMPEMPPAQILVIEPVIDSAVVIKNLKVKAYKVAAHASYYHDKFNGKRTASGKPFDNKKFTAAHRTLPFGSKVRLTNTVNNKSVVVEITDRGPFTKSREIDITKAAFMEIATNKGNGSVNVTIEIIQNNIE